MNYQHLYSLIAEGAVWILIIGIIVLLGLIAVGILYLLTLQGALAQVAPQNRKMQPGMVWLLLIPYFSTIYMFFVVKNISESLEAEYRMRGMNVEAKPTYNIGLVCFILGVVSLVLGFAASILPSFIALVVIVGYYVCWIIYWVQVAQHKNALKNAPMYQQGVSQIF